MESLSFVLVLGVLLSGLVILGIGILLLKKRIFKALFTGLMIAFSIANLCWILAGDYQLSTSVFSSRIGGIATLLTFPLATSLTLTFLHPRSAIREGLTLSALIIPAVGLGIWAFMNGVGAEHIYELQSTYLFVILCTVFGLVESTWGWLTTRTLKDQCYLFILGLLVMLATGPLYDFELKALGFQSLKGASLGAPLVGAFLLIPLVTVNPMGLEKTPLLFISKSRPFYKLERGRCYGVSERKPKYCFTLFRDLAEAGYPSLLLTSSFTRGPATNWTFKGATIIQLAEKDTSMSLRANNLGRILFTLTEFFETRRKPVVLLDCLHYLLSNNDVKDVIELIKRVRELVERNDGIFIISFALLTDREKALISDLGVISLSMPQPEEVIKKILEAHLGGMSDYLLKLSSKMMNKGISDYTIEDIPQIARIISHSMMALGRATNEETIMKNWKKQVESITHSLLNFQRASLSSLISYEQKGWDSLITQGREASGPRMMTKEKLQKSLAKKKELPHKVFDVFNESLGNFGSDLLKIECASLGINPMAIRREDLGLLARKVASTISEMGDFVDVQIIDESMKSIAVSLRKELERICKEESEWCQE